MSLDLTLLQRAKQYTDAKLKTISPSGLEKLTYTEWKALPRAVRNTGEYIVTEYPAKESGECNVIAYSDIIVAPSDWRADSTFEDYPYKAVIPIQGVDASYAPDITFSYLDTKRKILAPVADCGENALYIFSIQIPSDNVIIESAVLTRTNDYDDTEDEEEDGE